MAAVQGEPARPCPAGWAPCLRDCRRGWPSGPRPDGAAGVCPGPYLCHGRVILPGNKVPETPEAVEADDGGRHEVAVRVKETLPGMPVSPSPRGPHVLRPKGSGTKRGPLGEPGEECELPGPRKGGRQLVSRQSGRPEKGYKIRTISSAAPTNPKAESEALPMPGPCGGQTLLRVQRPRQAGLPRARRFRPGGWNQGDVRTSEGRRKGTLPRSPANPAT